MEITTYLKRKMAMLSLALASVEKSSLNQVSDALGSAGIVNETMMKGSMADSMIRGEITAEVQEMRWRMYKILNAADNLKTRVVGYDDDGLPITETTQHERLILRKINVDKDDPYPVELVVNNSDIVKSTSEALSNEKITLHKDGEDKEDREDRFDLVGTEKSKKNLGEISFEDMVSTMKSDKNITVHRSLRPKFEIEQYCNRLIVRGVDAKTKLLEFYITMYPDGFDRKTRLLISEIKKINKNPRASDILDIEKVAFITNKTIGAANGMEYIYEIKNFHKMVEFNGHYVLKFMATPIVNGNFMTDIYRLEDLEKKYSEKASKK
tara:strand:+ start:6100 stop:7071 length:972 start_codon:yes stop_codon:yes gene_type:complete